MKLRTRRFIASFRTGQGGQAIILVLILLVIGSLVLVPALSLSMTALRANQTYETRSKELYTADSGVQDAVWRVKYDYFGPDYSPYDFSTPYTYQTDQINGLAANVSIQNVWLPSNVTLGSLGLTTAEAQSIIEGQHLVVSDTAGAIPGQPFHVKIDYDPADPSENLTVTSIGVWLPQGFTYTPGSGTLENLAFSDAAYSVPTVSTVPGGTAIVWSYSYPYPLFTDFPGVVPTDSPMHLDLSFSYSPPADSPSEMPTGIGWITTQLADGSPSPYPISWDTETRIFKITSEVGNTSVEAYSSKSELTQMGNAINGEYVAIGNSLMITTGSNPEIRDTLLTDSTTSITTVPSDGDAMDAYLYWTGWRNDSHIVTILSDSGGSIDTNWSRAAPSDWSQGSGDYVGAYSGGGADAGYLTLNAQDLGAYTPGSVVITWDQSSAPGSPLFDDTADNFNNWTAGSAWSASGGEFTGTNNPGGSAAYLTMNAPLDLSGASPGALTLSWDQTENGNLSGSDTLYYAFSSDNGSTWSADQVAFSGNNPASPFSTTIPSQYLTSGFRLRFELSGFGSHKYCHLDNIEVAPGLTSSDGLDFAVSGDNGVTWSDNVQAFRGDVTSADSSDTYYLPAEYTTGQFMIRFETVGLTDGQSVGIDNFLVRDLPPDTQVTFEINGQQVSYDGSGNPRTGTEPLLADSSAVLLGPSGLGGYFYRCKTDVSTLVKTYPVNPGEAHHTGNASYTVGDVAADTGNYVSYAGWSMILVYASPGTAGHYLYLRDYFAMDPGYEDLDFDQNGQPGGDVTGFIIPEPIRDQNGNIIEQDAARITCFVGEGDEQYTGDELMITGQQSGVSLYLSNSASPWNNVWNGQSPGMSYPGIDVDTFEVPWSSGVLTPGDTSLHLDMYSGQDAWTFIYLILSVRSETQTSGTTHYLINRK